ncbi:MAG: tripartite tricarboxylate transporter permease, partial [Christensenellales bacterium]
MKKTHTKAFANLIASILLLCIEGWALFQTYGFKVVKKATVQPAAFPQIMCVGMIIFTVILLIQSIIKLISMSDDDPLAEPAASINFIKNKGVLAGLFVILLCVLFVAFFDSLGYVVVGMLLCGIIMWLIGKRNIVELLLVSILVPLGMWLVFYKMLSVNIPMGVLQPLRDLVDILERRRCMDWSLLASSYGAVFGNVQVIMMTFLGALGGVLLGAIPGMTATMGVALLIPFSFGMDLIPSVGLLLGIYCGGMYGGSISAILIHAPGTPSAAATLLDGYPMCQKGQAGKALSIAMFSSFCGGVIGALVMTFLSPT